MSRSLALAGLVLTAALAAGHSPLLAEQSLAEAAGTTATSAVDLFEAMESGEIEARMVLQSAAEGNLIIRNLGDRDLDVRLPPAYGVRQVNAQFGGGGFGGGGGGGAQTGGGGSGAGLSGGNDFGGGDSFFSIPAGEMRRQPYAGVCLEHGKPEPAPRMSYVPVPMEEVTTDPLVQEILLATSENGKMDRAAQAAVWHLQNGLSWAQLAAKTYDRVGRSDTPYYAAGELDRARAIVAQAKVRAEARSKKSDQKLDRVELMHRNRQ